MGFLFLKAMNELRQTGDCSLISATQSHPNQCAGGAGVRAVAESILSDVRAQYHLSGASADHVTSLVGHSLKTVTSTAPSYVFIFISPPLISTTLYANIYSLHFLSYLSFFLFGFSFLFLSRLSKGKASGFVVDCAPWAKWTLT